MTLKKKRNENIFSTKQVLNVGPETFHRLPEFLPQELSMDYPMFQGKNRGLEGFLMVPKALQGVRYS